MIELSDEEFQRLAFIQYGNQSIFMPGNPPVQPALSATDQKFLDTQLMEPRQVQMNPNENRDVITGSIFRCTRRGEGLLHKNLLRLVLVLAKMAIYTYGKEFFDLVDQLPKEDLPILLTHKEGSVRRAAKASIENRGLYLPTPDTTKIS